MILPLPQKGHKPRCDSAACSLILVVSMSVLFFGCRGPHPEPKPAEPDPRQGTIAATSNPSAAAQLTTRERTLAELGDVGAPPSIVAESKSSSDRRANVVLIVSDSLRADHVGCYGYSRETTPFIDSLAENGVLFEQAFSNSSYTRESISVLLSGLLPSSGGHVGWHAAPSLDLETLAESFQDTGYRTAFFSNTVLLIYEGFAQGFEKVKHLVSPRGTSRQGPKLSQRALEFVKSVGDQKFFMYLHYIDPHLPYDPPEENYLLFTDKLFAAPLPVLKAMATLDTLQQEGFGPSDPRFQDMVLRYDAEIRHTDQAIQIFLEGLDELGVLDDTVVIVTSDHGEEFLDHGYFGHFRRLYTESIHVPLIFWAPGLLKAERIKGRVSLVDIFPTLLRLMEITTDPIRLDGAALFAEEGSSVVFTPPKAPIISEVLIQSRDLARVIMAGDFKYLLAQRWTPTEKLPEAQRNLRTLREKDKDPKHPPHDIWGPVVHEELYDIGQDPLETRDLMTEAAPELEQLWQVWEDYKACCLRHKGEVSDHEPEDEGAVSPEHRQRLEALGYL